MLRTGPSDLVLFSSYTGCWGKISRNVKKRKLTYKNAEFRKIRYLLNIFFNPCRSTFHKLWHYFISDESCAQACHSQVRQTVLRMPRMTFNTQMRGKCRQGLKSGITRHLLIRNCNSGNHGFVTVLIVSQPDFEYYSKQVFYTSEAIFCQQSNVILWLGRGRKRCILHAWIETPY